jgi:DNA-binding NarL/FixJ family response regulator
VRTYLIEPQTIFVPFLRRILARAGLDVVATNTGVDDRDITSHDPAAILIDVDYLERSGPTALCRIRSIAHNARLIALSESTDSLFAATCVISGANAVCSKEGSEESLLSELLAAMGTA